MLTVTNASKYMIGGGDVFNLASNMAVLYITAGFALIPWSFIEGNNMWGCIAIGIFGLSVATVTKIIASPRRQVQKAAYDHELAREAMRGS